MPTPSQHPWFQDADLAYAGPLDVDTAVLDDALAQARTDLLPSFPDPLKPMDLMRWSLAAARILAASNRHWAEVLAVAATAPQPLHDRAGFALMRCNALRSLGDFDGLASELHRLALLAGQALDPRLIEFAKRQGLNFAIHPENARDQLLSRPIPNDPAAWYFDDHDIDVAPDWAANVDRYFQITGRAKDQAMLDRLYHAGQISMRDNFLWRVESVCRRVDMARFGLADAAAQLADLQERALDLVDGDMAPLQAELAAGRNVIVLRVHGGHRIPNLLLTRCDARAVMIANTDYPKPGLETLVVGNRQNAALAFVKLAKQMKRRRHVVLMMPDGGSGQATIQAPFDGRLARVGLGGAVLAQVHPSTLIFARTTQSGRRFGLELTMGARIEPGEERADVERQFIDLFLGGMRQMLTGTPEDLGGMGFVRTIADLPA